MTFLRKLSDGNYYICCRVGAKRGGKISRKRRGAEKGFKEWFGVHASSTGQRIMLHQLVIPKEFFGMRLMFRVVLRDDFKREYREVIKDE